MNHFAFLVSLLLVTFSWGQETQQELAQGYKAKLTGLEEKLSSKRLSYEGVLIEHCKKLKESYMKKGDLDASLYMQAVIDKSLPEGVPPVEYTKLKAKYDQSLLKLKQSYDKAVLIEKQKIITQGKSLTKSLVQAGKLAEAKNVDTYVKDLSEQIKKSIPAKIVKPSVTTPKKLPGKKPLMAGIKLLGKNLIENPSNELPLKRGKIQGWKYEEGYWTQRKDMKPHEGKYFFFAGKCVYGELEQKISLKDFTGVNGLEFKMTAYIGSYSKKDIGQVIIEFYRDRKLIKSYDSGTKIHGVSWSKIEFNGPLPKDAKELKVRLISTRKDGSDNNGYIDDVSFVITQK